jgi:hypothetical protein
MEEIKLKDTETLIALEEMHPLMKDADSIYEEEAKLWENTKERKALINMINKP